MNNAKHNNTKLVVGRDESALWSFDNSAKVQPRLRPKPAGFSDPTILRAKNVAVERDGI